MANKPLRTLKRIVKNPYVNIVVGIFFLYSGVYETVRELREVESFRIGVHHGVILFSILQILKTVPDFFEGLEYIDEVVEEKSG
jgi:hypothetical protein